MAKRSKGVTGELVLEVGMLVWESSYLGLGILTASSAGVHDFGGYYYTGVKWDIEWMGAPELEQVVTESEAHYLRRRFEEKYGTEDQKQD